jgi:endonuclease
VRLVVAHCTVDYDGRLTAHLAPAPRLIMVKADGCVAVHADGGAYKPLNWMNAPNTVTESVDADGQVVWVVRSPKGEMLTITLHEVLSDTDHALGVDPGLWKDGVEAHLQELLAANCEAIAPGLRLVRREYPTDIGVEQLARYMEFLGRDPMLRPVRGVFVAQQIKPQARVLARQRAIDCVEVDYDALRGLAPDDLRLF